jgi:hypothetical protein
MTQGRGVFIESLLLAAAALLVLNFHPFGSAHLRRHFSQDLVYAWFGNTHWLYPRPPPAIGKAADAGSAMNKPPRAVVILVDDAALALRGAQWPVPVSFHAELLAELDVLRPRAIMLDFLLIDRAPPEDVCALLQIAGKLGERGIPLYLAVGESGDLALLETSGCMNDAGRPLRARDVLRPVSVRRQVDDADFVSRRYPFEERGERDAPGSGLPSAAVRIYCDADPDPGACTGMLTRRHSREAGFELAWLPAGDPFNQRWSQAPCGKVTSPTRAILDQTLLPSDIGCPPIATLFASSLLSPPEDPALGLSNDELFDLVGDSFVFLGGNFRAGDLIATPMHSMLPGVYYHAVAFENLLIFGGKPKIREEFRSFKLGIYMYDFLVLWALAAIFLWRQRWVAGTQGNDDGPLDFSPSGRTWLANVIAGAPVMLSLILAIAACLILAAYPSLQLASLVVAVVVVALIEIRVTSQWELRMRLRNVALYFAALALSLTVVAVAMWFGYRWLSLPPGDWVGYLSFATVGFFLAHTAIVDFARHIGTIRGAQDALGGSD